MSCDCQPTGTISSSLGIPGFFYPVGMGQLDPIAIGSIFTEATALWNQLENALGIGAGRREADIVTPVQNKVQQQVIAPVYAFVDSVKSGQLTPTCTQVQ